ncbi:MAG: hypothetical protein LQ337_002170 [Flavoplaca oasis]|nr:MAG: hypothetical protein LQ337_002170 [Flavoplaca oasis]
MSLVRYQEPPHRGHRYQNLEAIHNYLQNYEGRERYAALCTLRDRFMERLENTQTAIARFYSLATQDVSFRTFATSDAQAWEPMRTAAVSTRERIMTARNSILKLWPEAAAEGLITDGASLQTLSSMRKVAKSFPYEEGKQRLISVMFRRLSQPGVGIRQTTDPTKKDWDRIQDPHRYPTRTPDNRMLFSIGLGWNHHGLLERKAALGMGPVSVEPAPKLPSNPEPVVGETFQTQCSSPVTLSSPVDKVRPIQNNQINSFGGLTSSNLNAAKLGNVHEDAVPANRRCTCGRVPDGLKRRLDAKKSLSTPVAISLLKEMRNHILVNKATFCFSHLHKMGGKLGLQMKSLTSDSLKQRLEDVYRARGRIYELKAGQKTYRWFRRSNRPTRLADTLGVYRIRPMPSPRFTFNPRAILRSLNLDWVVSQFHEDGNVLINGIFMYLFSDERLWDLLSEEFDMYDWHLRKIGGRQNLGWLRNALYTQVQQIVRSDPLYYILYACLRPDNNWRLISYPYYMKSTQVDDSTCFRHLDLNVPQLLREGRGASQIQGSLTLTDETEDNCTEMLTGAHRWLPLWWDRIKQRKLDSDGLLHYVHSSMWTPEDKRDFGDWKSLPCKRGTVRISMPHNPHGSTGPAAGFRQTILPWFVGIMDDNETLEVQESGTRSQLAAAHRDMTAPPNSPSGYPNKYGSIPFRFPAAIELCNVSPIADALVGRRLWDSPAVIAERNILLGPDHMARNKLIQEIRTRALDQARSNMQVVQQMERQAFGEKSYWSCREASEQWVSDDDEDPDSETEAAYIAAEEAAAGADVAEERSAVI